jgi:HD-GYP domain-containing protein (c-di-GMP phosphodiesterase class II)
MPSLPPDILQAFLRTIEMKDDATAAHTWRVVLYARALAESYGVNDETLKRITYAAAMHDLGKLDIPDEILRKPGKLTDEEFAVIKTHAALGHDRLVNMGEEDPIMLEIVRHHHERIDGKGYPDGLSGESIPVPARMFAVIDTFDAMTSVRPYRKEIGAEAAEKALLELKAGEGTRYDPAAVAAFTKLYRAGSLTWILQYFNDAAQLPTYGATDEHHHEVVTTVKNGVKA